ncbi:MAG TPA: DegT/DnrJ/EryC1/StrS family aminotransferase [Solirubrobacteraceae bacterium]|jgi:arginine/lysine/ornithine decarboxylase|nr:DegT/DnrJ/EryC1/StrS family aminotransferase [Solirubrobacteraceae bacterium]
MNKMINTVKAHVERRRSPVRADQSTVPIADAIADYWDRGMLTFSIPAHNGGRGPLPEFARWTGAETARADLPMSHGLDTRDRAWQVQATAQKLFAEASGAKQTMFSTNGSSMSVRIAILSVVGPGEELVLARNGHKSSFAGLVLSGAKPVYLDPVYDDSLEIALGPTAGDLAQLLAEHPSALAALVFTPSYYGTSADVRALADVCHDRGLPLVTDDAWGLDYSIGTHPALPRGAIARGSDLAIGSVHKSLTGLSQTSVLSVGSDRVDTERLQLCWELEESTSASALLLSSIDGARAQFVREGTQLLDRAVRSARLLRERLAAEVPELSVVASERLATVRGVHGVDPTHVMIDTSSVGLTGYEADDWLRDECHIDVELVDHRRIMPLVTFAHDEDDVARLVGALRRLVDERGRAPREAPFSELPRAAELRTEQAMLPRDAFFSPTEMVDLAKAGGRISAELVTPYPPGIPVVAPGERYTDAILSYLKQVADAGGFLEGAADQSLGRLRVVARA